MEEEEFNRRLTGEWVKKIWEATAKFFIPGTTPKQIIKRSAEYAYNTENIIIQNHIENYGIMMVYLSIPEMELILKEAKKAKREHRKKKKVVVDKGSKNES